MQSCYTVQSLCSKLTLGNSVKITVSTLGSCLPGTGYSAELLSLAIPKTFYSLVIYCYLKGNPKGWSPKILFEHGSLGIKPDKKYIKTSKKIEIPIPHRKKNPPASTLICKKEASYFSFLFLTDIVRNTQRPWTSAPLRIIFPRRGNMRRQGSCQTLSAACFSFPTISDADCKAWIRRPNP